MKIFNKTSKKEIFGLVLMLISALCFVSILIYSESEIPGGVDLNSIENKLGLFGIWMGYYFNFCLMGYSSISIPIILSIIGYLMFANIPVKNYKNLFIYVFVLSLWASTYIAHLSNSVKGGLVGVSLQTFLYGIFGKLPFNIIIYLSLLLLIAVMFNISIYDFLKRNLEFFKKKFMAAYKRIFNSYSNYLENRKNKYKVNNDENIDNNEIVEDEKIPKIEDPNEDLSNRPDNEILEDRKLPKNDDPDEDSSNYPDDEKNIDLNLSDQSSSDSDDNFIIENEDDIVEGDLDAELKKNSKFLDYKLPDSSYLEEAIEIKQHDEEFLKQKADQLSYALTSFGVSGNIVKISPGPVITLFEIEPAEGVRVNKFTTLSEDLSRIMGGKRVRIIAPIPGSKSVGVELPNESPSIVYLKTIISSKKYLDNKSKLKIALGKTTTGDAFLFELDKMPHLLVAGATGSGKSVCINTIIISILYNAKPDEVKFILMDPKKVELTNYKSLVGYHLITANQLDEYVMTTAENSVSILNSAINEMERRFQLFSEVRVRNIQEYNKKRQSDSSLENIPFLVVIIDELADLMMTSGRAIEEPITRLAQKARAIGLHLIVATQRPSVDVITGLIKSNFPARISFQVSSKIDSRTIIDQMGAEKLLGNGDMLFLLPGTASPIRIHNAYVTLEETERILKHISKQPKPDEVMLPEIKKVETSNSFDISDNQDEYLIAAAKLVVDSQQASVSLLQRKFRIGYSRAGRLIDELESLGIISGYSGSKARDVLVDHSYISEIFNE